MGRYRVADKTLEPPFKQGEYYVFDVEDEVARYWSKMAPARRVESLKAIEKGKQGYSIDPRRLRAQAAPHEMNKSNKIRPSNGRMK